MAEAAAARAAPLHRGLPDEITTWEILVRLPPTALLRCRAVCRAWRRATSARDFLLAHHARQPSLPLLKSADCQSLFTFDHRAAAAAQLQPVARLDQPLRPAGSCDGLLVFHNLGTPDLCYSIFNPATRQCARLPIISGFDVSGMYQHPPTGEYRILMYLEDADGLVEACYVFTLGSVQPPRIIEGLPVGYQESLAGAAVLVHGCLHWYPQPNEHASDTVVVFDTTAESFREMHAPFTPVFSCHEIDLFEMDGVLGLSSFKAATSIVDIWVLQDYESEVWTFKCLIKLPVTEIRVQCQKYFNLWNNHWTVRVLPGDDEFLVLVDLAECLLHVDMNGKLVATFYRKVLFGSTRFNLQQTLVPHTFFPALDDYVVNAPPFI